MKLTKSEAIANHRKMWNWIAEETLRQKCKVEEREYFKAHEITDIPSGESYCCDYAALNCLNCPIDWNGKLRYCLDLDVRGDKEGLYALWLLEPDYIKAAKLAKRIAELPEKKERR